jgi:hypothetical protein
MAIVGGNKLEHTKGFRNKMRILRNMSPHEIRNAFRTPEGRETMKLFKKQQKVLIPTTLAISGAYGALALRDDKRHMKKHAAVEEIKQGIYKTAFEGKPDKSPIESMFGVENAVQLKAAWRNVSHLEITEGDKVKLRQELLKKAKAIGVNTKGWGNGL